jgi:hypothetical protein
MGRKKVSAPTPRDYKQEMLDAMSAQEAIQPRLLALEEQYTPLYQQLQKKGIASGMEAIGSLYGQAGQITGGLQKQILDTQAPLYGQMGQAAMGAYQKTLDPSTMGLYNSLMQSAQSDLSAGRNLTPEMQKQAQQSARLAMAARGLSGNQAIAQEVLNSYQMADARENRARQFAGSMYDAGVGQANQAFSMYGTPLMSQMNAVSAGGLLQSGAGLYGSMGAKLFQPESQYNAQLITANRKEAMDAQIANAQSSNAFTSGLMGMAGAVGGAFLGNPALGSILGGATNSGMNLGAGMDMSIPKWGSSIAGSFGTNTGFGTYQGLGGQTLGGSYEGITSNFNPSIPQFKNF